MSLLCTLQNGGGELGVTKSVLIGLQNDEDENIGICQELFIAICRLKGVKSWDIPRLQFEKSWDIPKIGGPKSWDIPSLKHRKKMGYPKNSSGDLLPDELKVGRDGVPKRKSAFRKTYFPHKDLSLINIIYPLPIGVESISFTGENC